MNDRSSTTDTVGIVRGPSNRLGLDYIAESATFAPRRAPIIDAHSHILGEEAVRIYARAAEAYGIGLTYTMTPFDLCPPVQRILGDRVRFIAVPNWRAEDRRHEFTEGFLERIRAFHDLGARIVKFWVAPRSRDMAREIGEPSLMTLDGPWRRRAMDLATDLGMMFMVHVADPDTWFRTKYADASFYGTKAEQYEPLERLLETYRQPWIAAHMGGWPEDLEFLTGLLDRHENLYLDCSACKWQVRELSRHPRAELVGFLERFRGRVLFGSDIVTTDEHLAPSDEENPMLHKASSPAEAFDLYASRYWAYRTMFETTYEGESPIADPDLAMVEPDRYDEMAAPALVGRDLPEDLLQVLYHDAAHDLLEPYHRDHGG